MLVTILIMSIGNTEVIGIDTYLLLGRVYKKGRSIPSGMGEITVANKASSKFPSLRTTIPMSIVRQWKLQAGDRLDWEWKVIEGQMALVVSKVL
jgi:hypothetical protein